MKAYFFSIIALISNIQIISAQETSRFSASAHFGLNGNFSVRDYAEESSPGIPFFKKKFVGTAIGIETAYKIGKSSNLFLGYMRSENQRTVDFNGSNNGITLFIWSFTIRDIFNFFYGGYGYNFHRIKGLQVQGGLFYVRPKLQTIELLNNSIDIWERKFSNANFNELGVFVGIQYKRPVNANLEVGIQSRLFYEFTSNILNQVTLTPTLTYHFSKSKKKSAKS